jgi:hypothetical protein
MRRNAARIGYLLVCLVLIAAVCRRDAVYRRSEDRALERARAYAQTINYDFQTPERIYPYLCRDFRAQMSREAFCAAFAKERSYPYITPLYLFYPSIAPSEDGRGYTVTFLQAARIVGMTYRVEMVYEDGDYYVRDWQKFLDGSYLEKFRNIPYSLDWYYDLKK